VESFEKTGALGFKMPSGKPCSSKSIDATEQQQWGLGLLLDVLQAGQECLLTPAEYQQMQDEKETQQQQQQQTPADLQQPQPLPQQTPADPQQTPADLQQTQPQQQQAQKVTRAKLTQEVADARSAALAAAVAKVQEFIERNPAALRVAPLAAAKKAGGAKTRK
jgi:outer membrane biosynthesis protein TonB